MQFKNSLEPTIPFPSRFFTVEEKHFFFLGKRHPPSPTKKKAPFFRYFLVDFLNGVFGAAGVEKQVSSPAERQYFLLYRKDCQVLGEAEGDGHPNRRNVLTYQWMNRGVLALNVHLNSPRFGSLMMFREAFGQLRI